MPKRNLAWMLVVVVIALLLWQLPQIIAERDSVVRHFGPLAEIRAEIHRRYVEPVNDRELIDRAVHAGADEMIRLLRDPHARYLDPEEHQRFVERSRGVVGGIGAEVAEVSGRFVALNVMRDTPAEQAGIQRGDVILAIDGLELQRLDPFEAVNLLAGEPDTPVRLVVRTADEPPRELTLLRAALRVSPVRGWRHNSDGSWLYLLDAAHGIGYVRITEFLPDAALMLDDARMAMDRQGVRAWILDLRENRGGLLESAIEVADRFLDSGVIVSTRGTKGPTSDKREWSAQRDGTYPQRPMAVLVNGWTASSAEIVAGALRDHRRAVLVGERTYGKGSVQELIPLREGGAIKLTTRYYFLPSGACIQRTARGTDSDSAWGVQPNVVVALTPEQREAWVRHWLSATWAEPALSVVTTGEATSEEAAAASQAAIDAAVRELMASDPQLQRAVDLVRRIVTTQSASGPS